MSLKDIVRNNRLTDTDWSVDVIEGYCQNQWTDWYWLVSWCQTHYNINNKNNNVGFEGVDIHFHYYDSCQFWRCWHTFSLLSQLFLSDSTDNVSLDHDNWDFFYIKQGDDIFDCLDWFVSLNERQVLLWLLIKAGERWKSVNYTMGYRICLVISQKFGSENMLSRKFFYFYMWVWTSLDITKSGQFLPGILTIDD